MRGRRNPQASMLAFVDHEERVPPLHPLRAMKHFAETCTCGVVADIRGHVWQQRTSIDSARAVVEGVAADQVVLGTQ